VRKTDAGIHLDPGERAIITPHGIVVIDAPAHDVSRAEEFRTACDVMATIAALPELTK
jgi:hypothetical protein